MIQDARVLRDEFLPTEVRHRDQEVTVLSRALEPITEGDPGEAALLFGPSGTGKTCIARFTLDRLRESVLDINTHYVNCWSRHSTFRVLEQLCDGIDRAFDIRRQSTPTDELLERLREYDGPPYVVVLDEVDQLDDLDVLYEIYSIRRVTPVLIANEEDTLFARMDGRVASRFHGAPKIHFHKYGLDELVSILEDRVRWGLHPDAVNEEGLELIADAAAGDAREAIAILRNAAREAEREDRETIPHDLIRDSVSEGKTELRQATLSRLNSHQRTLYSIIAEHEEIGAGDLYEEYCARVAEPKTQRHVRNYLSKLRHYNLIEAEGEKRWRRYAIVE